MRNLISPFMVLIVINELCGNETETPKNTGRKGPECLEGVLERPFVAKAGFKFATFADFKDKTKWLTAIEAKDIVPLFAAYNVAPANTDAVKYETGKFSYETSPAVKKTTFESYIGFCSYAALDSYGGSEYTQIFEFNNDGSIVGVNTDDGGVKGQDLESLNVGIRTIATNDKPATTVVTLSYKDHKQLKNAAVIKPIWAPDLQGIFDLELKQVSATTTAVEFTALTDCGKRKNTSLVAGDIIVRDAEGAVITVTFIPADANGVYRITGTFEQGSTIEIDGVVTQAEIMYEGENVLVVDLTP